MLHTKLFKIYPKLIIFILLLNGFHNLQAQTDEQIINEIFSDLFNPFQEWFPDTIYIKKEKINTFLREDVSYENIMGFVIPSNIIFEWEENMKNKNFDPKWNEERLNIRDTIFIGKDTVLVRKPVFKCLSKNEIDKMVAKNQKTDYTNQERIYSIGKIVFDNSKETAIFRFDNSSAVVYTVLIKKIFGKWVIIANFDYYI
jgi:hypothetical protein